MVPLVIQESIKIKDTYYYDCDLQGKILKKLEKYLLKLTAMVLT